VVVQAGVADPVEMIFEDKRYAEKCWAHNLIQLVDIAGLRGPMDADRAADPDLAYNWEIVKDWSEASRCARTAKVKAEELRDASADKKHGVFSWIKARW